MIINEIGEELTAVMPRTARISLEKAKCGAAKSAYAERTTKEMEK